MSLADGRQETAKLVGADPDSDLAVLKIALDHLPAITFNPDSAVRVGDVVLAIGNPFGVGQTTTQGIVSALGAIAWA
ncbi:Serine protease DegQ OS=Castellaniella defragrans OX=75697 GN=HNR28_000243 PE=4 SV=1 [Castellaniella defragrans]